jgi:hypothetical protein
VAIACALLAAAAWSEASRQEKVCLAELVASLAQRAPAPAAADAAV